MVIRSAQDLVKDVIAEVVAYASALRRGAVLVLVHPGGVKGKALVDGVKKAGAKVVTVSKVTKAGERLDFVKSRGQAGGAEHRAGRRCRRCSTPWAMICGSSRRRAASSRSTRRTRRINVAAVARYHRGGRRSAGSPWPTRRSRGGWARRWSSCGGRSAPGSAPVLLVSALAGGLRSLREGGRRASQSAGRAAGQPSRDAAVEDRPGQAAAERLGPRGLSHAIQAVADADEQVKGGGADPAYALEHTVQTIVANRNGR